MSSLRFGRARQPPAGAFASEHCELRERASEAGARGRTCKRAYDNRHYVSRRKFTGRRFLNDKRADYVMPDYRMTVLFLTTFLRSML
jgi:hypothetical protein